ncbi:alpha/beta fold hydrolase [Buchnera aphidicola (Taiwanaphis decaspermi)]|uniref:alpha/beta fold hydrolase n=1 Tax=Buchnera aphidicola TaxID=9 RepID=UPI0031B885AA
MNKFIYKIIGNGKTNLIMIHGLGFNNKVWYLNIPYLKKNFTLYLIDLPGFGKNKNINFKSLEYVSRLIYNIVPKNSVWLGWSLGGLIVNKIALLYPDYIKALVIVASSPCFVLKKKWPGITIKNINKMFNELKKNTDLYIKKFMLSNVFIYKNENYNFFIKKRINNKKISYNILKDIKKIFLYEDLRKKKIFFKIPVLRIYGEHDKIIPKSIVKILDKNNKNTYSKIIKHAAHAPFISQPKIFNSIIINFIKNLKKK